jgi:hypothetical protein
LVYQPVVPVHGGLHPLISPVVLKVVVGNDDLEEKTLLNLVCSQNYFEFDTLEGVDTGDEGQVVRIVGGIVEEGKDNIVEWEKDDAEVDRDEEIEEGNQRVEVEGLEVAPAVDSPSGDKRDLVA